MRYLSFLVAFVGTISSVALWAGCVGDDPFVTSSGGPDGGVVGEQGARCFSDGRCKEGLVCVQGVVCLHPGEGIDGGTSADGGGEPWDGGPNDAGADASPGEDGGGGSCKVLSSSGPELDCPLGNGGVERCSSGNVCCPGAGCVQAVGGGCASNTYKCFADSCSGATFTKCCLSATLVQDPNMVCGLTARVQPTTAASTACSDTCNGLLQLCRTAGSTTECPVGQICKEATIPFGGIPFRVNVCE
ncbi:MAG TPA: hypothetical protein VM925_21855 [Labilithrix sp.]|nr:hypothetical protein [Labilithrix sp.]